MKVYHTYSKSHGFDINKLDFKRGIFTLPETHKFFLDDPWSPDTNWGNSVVELEIDPSSSKVYTNYDQVNAIKDLVKDKKLKHIILNDWMEIAAGSQEDNRRIWHAIDKVIGTILVRKGYDLWHLTAEMMYGDVWAILNKRAIRSVNFQSKK